LESYNEEQKALELYREKKKQDQAMAFYEAHLEAQAALKKAEESGKTKKKKPTKDPSAPKRITSSYMFFAQEMRATVVEQNPEAPVTEIAKILGEMWKNLDKKKSGKGGAKKYEDMAAKDRARYAEEKAQYDLMVQQRVQEEAREKEARLEQEKKEAMELMLMQHPANVQVSVDGATDENMTVVSDLSGSNMKKKKDPNAPKRALTAYNFFMKENREPIKGKMSPDVTNAELLTEIGKQWKELSVTKKNKYQKMADKDKIRYVKEMGAYNQTKGN